MIAAVASPRVDEGGAARPRKKREAKASPRTSPEKVKVSIVLTADVDFKLSVASAAMRIDRSALVNQILAESPTLRRYVVSVRGGSSESPGPGDTEVSTG